MDMMSGLQPARGGIYFVCWDVGRVKPDVHVIQRRAGPATHSHHVGEIASWVLNRVDGVLQTETDQDVEGGRGIAGLEEGWLAGQRGAERMSRTSSLPPPGVSTAACAKI